MSNRMMPSPASPKLLAQALIATAVWLLLAIWGWGDWTTFFASPARAGAVIVTILLTVAACFSGTQGFSTGRRELRSNRWVLGPVLALALLAGWPPPWAERHGWWVFDGDGARYMGLFLFTVGGVFRIAAVFQLGRRFSALVAIQPDHPLKTDGLYRYVRHPSYLGAIMAAVGWSLIFRGGTGLLLTAAMLLVLIGRIRAEEQFLADEFGDEYRAFQRQTRWRLLPGVY